MPDSALYVKAFLFSGSASAVIALAFSVGRYRIDSERLRQDAVPLVGLLSLMAGIFVGCWWLEFRWNWPPASAMDRFLTLILPASLIVELASAVGLASPRILRILRAILAVSCGRILLHGSVWLQNAATNSAESTAEDSFAAAGITLVLVAAILILAVVWSCVLRLVATPAGPAIPVALAMCIQAAGISIMLTGYIRGGAIAIPLVSSILVTSLALRKSGRSALHGVTSVAVICLFSVLFIGRFFGALSTIHALAIFLTPLLCGVARLPRLRCAAPRTMTCVCLSLVSIPLLIVLLHCGYQFSIRMLPLLAHLTTAPESTGSPEEGMPVDGATVEG